MRSRMGGRKELPSAAIASYCKADKANKADKADKAEKAKQICGCVPQMEPRQTSVSIYPRLYYVLKWFTAGCLRVDMPPPCGLTRLFPTTMKTVGTGFIYTHRIFSLRVKPIRPLTTYSIRVIVKENVSQTLLSNRGIRTFLSFRLTTLLNWIRF
jgi:hypothetical protein